MQIRCPFIIFQLHFPAPPCPDNFRHPSLTNCGRRRLNVVLKGLLSVLLVDKELLSSRV